MTILKKRLNPAAALQLADIETVDICIVVPKQDEFMAHLGVFSIGTAYAELSTLKSDDRYPFAVCHHAGLTVVLVCMADQGNTAAGICAREVLVTLAPAHIYLSGTSLGNRSRTGLGSIRIADRISHAAQWVDSENGRVPRWRHYDVPAPIRRDLGNYVADASMEDVRQALVIRLQQALPDDWTTVWQNSRVDVELAPMVSDNELFRTDGRRIWSYDERSASYDMESGGFAEALVGEPEVHWAVIRGISDFGSDKATAELGGRQLAASAAAVFLYNFIRDGLRKSHPRAMRPSQTVTATLSPSQHYNQYSASAYFRRRVEEQLGCPLPAPFFLSRELTLDDLAAFCETSGLERQRVLHVLRSIRTDYFDEKYLDYAYDLDLRGYHDSIWHEEFREFVAGYMRESPYRATILDVGCGNGLELLPLFEGAERVIGADVSQRMLARAAEKFPGLAVLRTEAEHLEGVGTQSVDMYVSLRTFMSRFFDVRAALREAYRVLKPGGLLVLSVAAGYLDEIDGRPTIVRGLKEVNGSEFVDVDRPSELIAEYHKLIRGLGFEQIYFSCKLTDAYIGGRKPGNLVASSPRLLTQNER